MLDAVSDDMISLVAYGVGVLLWNKCYETGLFGKVYRNITQVCVSKDPVIVRDGVLTALCLYLLGYIIFSILGLSF